MGSYNILDMIVFRAAYAYLLQFNKITITNYKLKLNLNHIILKYYFTYAAEFYLSI